MSLDLIAYTLLCVLGCIDHDPATSPRSMVRLISAEVGWNLVSTIQSIYTRSNQSFLGGDGGQ